MAPRRSTPPSSSTVEADRNTLRAARLLPDYAPHSQSISREALGDLETRLNQAEEAEFQATTALVSARNARVALIWELHDAALSVKDAVLSQYGANSDAVQAIGLKKKVDYRRPARRNAKPDA